MVSSTVNDELARITASLSNSILEVSRGPIADLEAAVASPAGAVASLASISRSLSDLASFASIAASLASLMHRIKSTVK
jgi:hypothetical protein